MGWEEEALAELCIGRGRRETLAWDSGVCRLGLKGVSRGRQGDLGWRLELCRPMGIGYSWGRGGTGCWGGSGRMRSWVGGCWKEEWFGGSWTECSVGVSHKGIGGNGLRAAGTSKRADAGWVLGGMDTCPCSK